MRGGPKAGSTSDIDVIFAVKPFRIVVVVDQRDINTPYPSLPSPFNPTFSPPTGPHLILKRNPFQLLPHFQSLPKLISLSSCLLSTFAVARSKSSCVTCTLLSRSAYIPASVQTPFNSAPEQPFIFSAIFVRLMPRVRFMLRLWMRRMSARASTLK